MVGPATERLHVVSQSNLQGTLEGVYHTEGEILLDVAQLQAGSTLTGPYYWQLPLAFQGSKVQHHTAGLPDYFKNALKYYLAYHFRHLWTERTLAAALHNVFVSYKHVTNKIKCVLKSNYQHTIRANTIWLHMIIFAYCSEILKTVHYICKHSSLFFRVHDMLSIQMQMEIYDENSSSF